MRRLLITTGNGMFGGAVARALANEPGVACRAMVRNVAGFTLAADNVEVVQGDMDKPESLVAATTGVSDVFLVSPMDDHIAQREMNVVDAVVANSPNARILKLHGAVEHRGDPLSQLHQRSIDHIKQSGLRWTLICPNSVMETSFLPLAQTIKQGTIYGTSGDGKVGFVALKDVARATAEVFESDSFQFDSVMLTGPAAVDVAQVAADFSAVLGRDIAFKNMSEDDYANMLLQFGAFPDRETLEMQVLCHYRAWARGDASLVADGFQKATGEAPTSVRQWITENTEAFR